MRLECDPEEITGFRGHCGTCHHCGGMVKMSREVKPPFDVELDSCTCLRCGQAYFVKFEGTPREFDKLNWQEKAEGLLGFDYGDTRNFT